MTVVFDVNETLLDLSALDDPFESLFGDAPSRTRWFSELLHQALVTTASNRYVDLRTLADAALDVVARRAGLDLDRAARASLLEGITQLPAHEDVKPALQTLRKAGIPCAALSNGPPETLHAQLDHAGLTDWLDPILSADTVRALKPDPAPYHYAAESLNVQRSSLWMVAAHPWDTSGAIRAGCRAALLVRPGTVLSAADERPSVIETDLRSLANRLVERAERDDP